MARRKAGKFSKELVDAMWRLFKAGASEADIAQQLGVSKPAVRRYVETGDAVRGITPFRERMARIIDQAERIADIDDIEIVAGQLKLARGVTGLVSKKVVDRLEKEDSTASIRELTMLMKEQRDSLAMLRAMRGDPLATIRHEHEHTHAVNDPSIIKALGGMSYEQRAALTALSLEVESAEEADPTMH